MRPRVLTNQIFSFIVMNQIFSFKLLNLPVLHVFISASDNLIVAGLLLPTQPFSPQPRPCHASPATPGNLSDKAPYICVPPFFASAIASLLCLYLKVGAQRMADGKSSALMPAIKFRFF